MKTPTRCIRIDDDTWTDIERLAASFQMSTSEWVRRAVRHAVLEQDSLEGETERRVAMGGEEVCCYTEGCFHTIPGPIGAGDDAVEGDE